MRRATGRANETVIGVDALTANEGIEQLRTRLTLENLTVPACWTLKLFLPFEDSRWQAG